MCQTRNSCVIIDAKQHVTTSQILYICDCHLKCHMDLQKQICLPNKEYLSGHRLERTNIAAKCKIFVTII